MRRQDVVARGVERAAEAEDARALEAALLQVEDRGAVHDRALVEEETAASAREGQERPTREGHRAFVGGHHVQPALQGQAHVAGGGLAAARIEGGHLDSTSAGTRRTKSRLSRRGRPRCRAASDPAERDGAQAAARVEPRAVDGRCRGEPWRCP